MKSVTERISNDNIMSFEDFKKGEYFKEFTDFQAKGGKVFFFLFYCTAIVWKSLILYDTIGTR